jgi:hypothetical protein
LFVGHNSKQMLLVSCEESCRLSVS